MERRINLLLVDASKEFAEKAGGGNISWKAWEGFYHELHHEPERKEVLQTILDWLQKQFA